MRGLVRGACSAAVLLVERMGWILVLIALLFTSDLYFYLGTLYNVHTLRKLPTSLQYGYYSMVLNLVKYPTPNLATTRRPSNR